MLHQIDVLPVVEARTPYRLGIHREPDRMHHMQAQLEPQTEPPHVACVGRDLGLVQRDVQGRTRHGLLRLDS